MKKKMIFSNESAKSRWKRVQSHGLGTRKNIEWQKQERPIQKKMRLAKKRYTPAESRVPRVP